MKQINRRDFLLSSSAMVLASGLCADTFAEINSPKITSVSWDQGNVNHILPTVNNTEMLIKVSFGKGLESTPYIVVNGIKRIGRLSDTQGQYWSFYATGLKPKTNYQLSLYDGKNQRLCEPWQLATFPDPKEQSQSFRLLIYSCGGGHEINGFLPPQVRNQLLKRGLSFQPNAVVANGDHVYWDLLAPVGSLSLGASRASKIISGEFNRSEKILGSNNESVLKKAVTAQITNVYGNDFRSTPMFFLQDDHDYFENDEATDEVITFPPSYFMTQLARTTQSLYYPEFLSDVHRPKGLAWSGAADRFPNVSESFGTLRYGNLVEIVLYDVRRTQTLAGPSAVFVDLEVENWLKMRTSSSDVKHLVHVPSNPPGWTAGKWGEWYPDVLDANNKLTVTKSKPYWQSGWLKQHDRLMQAISNNKNRIPLVISGDLHAIAVGKMTQSGTNDFSNNPINIVLPGSLGTRPTGWPSGRRGTGALPSLHVNLIEKIKPIEQHGFTIVDFTPNEIKIKNFKWNKATQNISEIDSLMPFHEEIFSI